MKKQKLLELVYIASPYSPQTAFEKLPIIRNIIKYIRFRQISKIIGILRDRFPIAMIAPITQSHIIGKYRKNNDGGFDKWKLDDLTYIAKCDYVIVVMLKGWKSSIGVQEEIKFAKKCKKIILYCDSSTYTLTGKISWASLKA